jgi:REP element-mobilizing transposase RayT
LSRLSFCRDCCVYLFAAARRPTLAQRFNAGNDAPAQPGVAAATLESFNHMADTYTALFYHFVFSTKNRMNCIVPNVEERLWAYIGGIARKHGLTALQVGGIEDHVHVLVLAAPTYAPCEIAKYLKGDSSRWLHEEFPHMRDFAWQDGYGAFTASKSNVPAVISYIQNQREHHQRKSFQREYLELLRRHSITYDEKYLWG